jgi:hypothetical protein
LHSSRERRALHLEGRNSNPGADPANVVETTTAVEVTGRYSNRQIAQIACNLIDFALVIPGGEVDAP